MIPLLRVTEVGVTGIMVLKYDALYWLLRVSEVNEVPISSHIRVAMMTFKWL